MGEEGKTGGSPNRNRELIRVELRELWRAAFRFPVAPVQIDALPVLNYSQFSFTYEN